MLRVSENGKRRRLDVFRRLFVQQRMRLGGAAVAILLALSSLATIQATPTAASPLHGEESAFVGGVVDLTHFNTGYEVSDGPQPAQHGMHAVRVTLVDSEGRPVTGQSGDLVAEATYRPEGVVFDEWIEVMPGVYQAYITSVYPGEIFIGVKYQGVDLGLSYGNPFAIFVPVYSYSAKISKFVQDPNGEWQDAATPDTYPEFAPGATVNYRIVVENKGTGSFGNLVVTDDLHPELGGFTADSLEHGDTVMHEYAVVLGGGEEKIVNTACATATSEDPIYPVPLGCDSAGLVVAAPPAQYSATIQKLVQDPDGVWQDAATASAYPEFAPGTRANYRIVVTNTGTGVLKDVAVTDDLQPELGGFTVSSLDPGASEVHEYAVTLGPSEGTIVNEACAEAMSDLGKQVDVGCDSAGLVVAADPVDPLDPQPPVPPSVTVPPVVTEPPVAPGFPAAPATPSAPGAPAVAGPAKLAVTGFDATLGVALGVGILLIGLAAMLLRRRRVRLI